MNPPIHLRAFVGYQIDSEFHESQDLKKMGEAIILHLRKLNRPAELEVAYGEFAPGAKLWDQLAESIKAADICLFEISENNPNVLLEAGIAVGSGKHVILLKKDDSVERYTTPSDIHSFLYITYSSCEELWSEPFLKQIEQSVDFLLRSGHDSYFYHRCLWALNPYSQTIVVPGRLPDDLTGNSFEDYVHVRSFGDLDALLLVIETLYRLYPGMDVDVHSSPDIRGLPKNWRESNLVLIGGPDFNPLVNEFHDMLPLEYVYSEEEEIWLRHKKTGREYRPQFSYHGGKRRAVDYGFFFKRKHSRRSPAKLVILGGVRTWGVYGAAMLAGCTGGSKNKEGYQNAKLLIEALGSDPSFILPIQVEGTADGIKSPLWRVQDVEPLFDSEESF